MSATQETLGANRNQPFKSEPHESEYLYQKRPMTSFSKNQSDPLTSSNYNVPRMQSPSYSIKPANGLVRPSTVSSTFHASNNSENHRSLAKLKQSRMPLIGSQSMAGLFQNEKNDKNAAKKIPSNILHDKEKLYETQLQLRSVINGIQDENIKLKTRNLNLEREAKKFERIIEEQNAGKNSTQQQQKENALSIRLRKQLKECQRDMELKNSELEGLKKQMTTTRLQELEIENKVLNEESLKLKYKLEQCLKLNTGFGFDQGSEGADGMTGLNRRVETLKKDNLEMAVLIQKLENEKNEIHAKAKETERLVAKLVKEKMFMSKQLIQQEEELKRGQRDEYGSPNGKKQHNQGNGNMMNSNNNVNNGQTNAMAEQILRLRGELEKISKENTKLNNQLVAKSERVKELEDKLRRDSQDYQERIELLRMQKETSERNLAAESQILQNQQERIAELEQQIYRGNMQDSKKGGEENGERGNRSSQLSGNTRTFIQSEKQLGGPPNIHTNNKRSSLLMQKRMMPRVTNEDVKKIGQDLKFNLLIQRIRFEEIDNYLIGPDLKKKERATILEMIQILMSQPFNMEKHEDALSIARYSIEDNSEDKIIFNENQSSHISVIKTVFKNLIGKYEIFQVEEELDLYSHISQLFTQERQRLKQDIEYFKKQSKENLDEGVCRLEDIKKSIDNLDSDMKLRHIDYIIMKIYEESHDTNYVLYEQLLNSFSVEGFERFRDQNQPSNEGDKQVQSFNKAEYEQGEEEEETNNENDGNYNEINNGNEQIQLRLA